MKHPSEATLALYAGRDLGWLARWRTDAHLSRCQQCRREVESYQNLRIRLGELDELPGLNWSRLAAEMKANIRVGLAAGECVTPHPIPRLFAGPRGLVAAASVVALLLAGFFVSERPEPSVAVATANDGVVLQATANGIELKEGGQVLSLLHKGADVKDVTYTAGAQGSIRARYVDADTGNVTINNVYVQ